MVMAFYSRLYYVGLSLFIIRSGFHHIGCMCEYAYNLAIEHSHPDGTSKNLTFAELSKHSDIGVNIVVYEKFFIYLFQSYLRNEEIVVETNIAETYYSIGRLELH